MIHTIRKLAREIHRRAVWQVISLHAVLGWLAVAAAARLTTWVGLPAWTPSLTLAMVVLMLPLVVATAVVQNGIPGLRIEDALDPNELTGLTPEEVHVVPEAHPLHGGGPFTWRNTVLGGVAAAALLLASVVAYLTMWALGIGPVGSLLAQGVIEEGELVAVATFANLTDDPSLGALVSDIIESDLMACDVVRVASVDDRPAGESLVITGAVATDAEGYRISARIVYAGSGVSLARFEEVTSAEDGLPTVVELLSERVREKLGESLRSVRRGPRPASLESSSAEALRLFERAGHEAAAGNARTAVGLLYEALAIDPAFALAWRALGAAHERMADPAEAVDAYRHAVDLWSGVGINRRTVRELRVRIAALGAELEPQSSVSGAPALRARALRRTRRARSRLRRRCAPWRRRNARGRRPLR